MKRKFNLLYLMIIFTTLVFSIGCSNKNTSSSKIAYISTNVNSPYEKTFKDLNLGTLFDFNLKLPNPDKSWVTMWVEGYSNGKPIDPFQIIQLSYISPSNEVEESQVGFGILNLNNSENSSERKLFLYSANSTMSVNNTNENLFVEPAISSWEYAISDESLALEPGEELLLAVYRQGKDSLSTGYDYQDSDSVNEMINESMNVLLLKIKVEEKNNL